MRSVFALLLVLLIFSSCAPSVAKTKPVEEKAVVSTFDTSQRPPVQVEIVKSYLAENDSLNVKVMLKPEVAVNPEEILLLLQGLDEGDVVAMDEKFLSELTPFDSLRADQSVAVMMKLPSSNFSEYQVKLSWGKEAVKTTKTSQPEVQRARLDEAATIQETEVAREPELAIISHISAENYDCESDPCKILYELYAELENKSEVDISEIVLALGLYWEANGKEVSFPANFSSLTDNEKAVDLGLLSLLPGETKRINLKVDRAVPVSDKGKFIPHVRILRAEEIK